MLVLTRKAQQRIQVGDNITITIVRVKGQSVRVGIEAPHDVRVIRGELQFDDGSHKAAESQEPQASMVHAESVNLPRTGGSLRQKVAAVTERVRVDAFPGEESKEGVERFNPADHRMEMGHGGNRLSAHCDSSRVQVISGRATLPLNMLGKLNPR